MLISPKITRAIALSFALLGISSASILLVVVEQEISPYAATFNRLGIAAILFLFWNSYQQITQVTSENWDDAPPLSLKKLFLFSKLTPLDVGLLVTSGLAFSVSLTLWAWSLSQTSVANSTLLNNMMPIFTTLGAWILFNQTFSRKFLLGMGLAIFGAIAISFEDLQVTGGFVGDEAALGAAMLSAVNILSIERLRKRFETPWIMMWTSLIGSFFLMLVLSILQDQFFPKSSTSWMAVIAMAVVSQVLGQGLLTYCLKEFSAGFVSVSMLAIPVIAAIAAMIFLGEELTLLNWSAFGIVLLGIYISVSAQNKDHPENNTILLAGTNAEAVD